MIHFFLWMGHGLPSLQYLHLSSGTGMIDFTMRPYFRLGMLVADGECAGVR